MIWQVFLLLESENWTQSWLTLIAEENDVPLETARVNWGVCDSSCNDIHDDVYDTAYTEANLTIFDKETCKAKEPTIDTEKEFCAGRKNEVMVDLYKVKHKGDKGTQNGMNDGAFINLWKQWSSLFTDIRRFSYRVLDKGHFGGSDACQGDSGGPIWRTVSNPDNPNFEQAVVVGIVKQGRGKKHKYYP